MFGRFCSWFLWKKYFLKVHLNAKIVRYLSGNTDNLSLFRKLWEEMNLIESELFDSKRAFFPGVKNVPELILSPLSFDFPGTKPRAFQVHMGMQMFERRKEDSLDRLFEKKYNTIKEKDIIFCSFGTLSFVHNKNLYKLVSLIAHLAEKVFTRYEFIFSVPLEMHFINSQLPNIHFFERVPQQQILKRCTLFITHGGINSIMEGIHFEVPMLVCPLNTKWDQPGNAARVENHQFGLKLIPEKEKERAVKDKLNLLLEKRDFFKENIRVYKENIIEDEVKFSKIMINRVLQG
ncbi:MAG: glycosyltransferase [Cyclobacteriaceae bacterium]|nr:glycosyltransferase [Cyclobacteriaceae bacterium]